MISNKINDKPILLMLHGFTANKDNWLQMSLFLNKKYRIIALDLLGHGESDSPFDADYSVEAQVKRVHLFVTKIQLAPFHILGSSMGGQIAATYAALFPKEVLSVTLFDNAGIDSPIKSDMFRDLASNRPNPLIDCTNPIEYFNYTFYKSTHIPKFLKQTHLALQAHKKRLHHKIFNDFHHNDLLPYLNRIQVPVLIIWGEKDRILDKSALDKICPLLNNVQVILLKNTGHLPMIESPKKSAVLFNHFVEQLKN
ncbi:alpha/beta hydrolase [Shewanella sp. E94]|nr:alpha/beta hydrolase [Shewanella sp. E94]MEC4736383.1 alpha/beta hydrolase [Shewanella sp. E94]